MLYTNSVPRRMSDHKLSTSLSEVKETQARAERLLEELVVVDSPTTHARGVNAVHATLARELRDLGFKVDFVRNPGFESADLLVAELAGERSEFITLVSHADTALGTSAFIQPYTVNTTLGRAYGSGVIDNKGGLVVAIEGLRSYLQPLSARGAKPAFSLRFVSSPNEEGGSLGYHELFKLFSRDSALVLGFEPALENGSIIDSRRGNRWYQIDIKGQEAHAGRCKGEQINAAHELALKISRLHELNDATEGVSVNIGQFQGGRDRFNIVCGEASAKLDARFASFASRDALHERIESILFTSFVSSPVTGRKSVTTYSIVDDCPPFSTTPESAPLVSYHLEQVRQLEGRDVLAESAGGAGDVNHMSREGVIVLDGLGPVGGRMHTTEEFIELSTLSSRAHALARLLGKAEELL